jgi:hypothetical protein
VNRRSGPWIIRILFALALVAGLAAPHHASVSAASHETIAAATAPPADDIEIDEANPFLPENRDLTDCVGMLQRPGCGSEARGGWHQNAVAIVMVTGLLIIFGRVAWGVRRSQKNAAATTTSPD